MLSPQIIVLYNLEAKIHDGYVYAEVCKGMYGLPQAGKLANDCLRNVLAPAGYVPCTVTLGLWRHQHSNLMFSLVVVDFGICYTKRDDVKQLIAMLQREYKCTIDWEGNRYVGLTLSWDYDKGTCNISMPGYIQRALLRFEHPNPGKAHDAPHAWNAPAYGARQQYATLDTSPRVDARNTKTIQEVLGTLLYYARAIDCTMLAAIGTIATQQASATKATMRAITELLNYCLTHPNAVIRYTKSDMVLYVESDASYLSESKARSRYAGYHYLSSTPPRHPNLASLHTRHPHSTDPSTSCAKSCAKSYRVHPKPSSPDYSTMGRRPHPSVLPWRSSGTPNRPRRSSPTTAPPLASPTILSNRSDPNQWICDTTGSATASARATIRLHGGPVILISPITSPSTTLPSTTVACSPGTCTSPMQPPPTIMSASMTRHYKRYNNRSPTK
jgi:hypothetical protein